MTCGYGKCFNEQDPKNPCSANCISDAKAMDPEIRHHCHNYNTDHLERLPNPKDCESYYICRGKDADPLLIQCPPNQHYSEKQKTCLAKTEAMCSLIAKRCERQNEGLRLVHYNCFQYYECHRGKIYTEICPYNEQFDKVRSMCVPGKCDDDRRIPVCIGQEDGTTFPQRRCYMYYECQGGKTYSHECPGGEYFDGLKCIKDDKDNCLYKYKYKFTAIP